jgi:hypothetical protein
VPFPSCHEQGKKVEGLAQNFYPVTGTWLTTWVVTIDKAELIFCIGDTDAGT